MVTYIILSDTEDERSANHVSDEESHYSGLRGERDSETEPEEDPEELPEEEEAKIREVTPLPPKPSASRGKRIRITKTARMSVVQPRSHGVIIREPEAPTPPPPGPYFIPAEDNPGFQPTPPDPTNYDEINNPKWDKISKYLRRWRRDLHFPAPPECGESSNVHQLYPHTLEPPHHTTPLLVAVTHEHERRLDQIDIGMMEMPGYQEIDQLGTHVHTLEARTGDLNDRVLNMGHHLGLYQQATNSLMDREVAFSNHLMATSEQVARVTNEVEAVRSREYAGEMRMVDVERRMGEMESHIQQFNTQMNELRAYMNAWDLVPSEYHGNQ